MSRDADDRSRLRRTLATWTIVFAIAAAFAVGQVALNRQEWTRLAGRWASYRAELAQMDRNDAAFRRAMDAYSSTFRANQDRDVPLTTAEATLNGGQAFGRTEVDGQLRWADAVTGGEAFIDTRRGVWSGVTPVAGGPPAANQAYIGAPGWRYEAVHRLRRWSCSAFLFFWPALLCAIPANGRAARVRLSIHLLGVACLATFLACLGPQYLRVLRDFFQDDAAAWGWITIPTSAALVAWSAAPRRSDSDEPRCPRCGYNLTGNASGVCPECGTRVATTEVR